MGVFPGCVALCCVRTWYPGRPVERVRFPGTGVTCVMQGIKPGSSGRVTNALNCWAISLIPPRVIFKATEITGEGH